MMRTRTIGQQMLRRYRVPPQQRSVWTVGFSSNAPSAQYHHIRIENPKRFVTACALATTAVALGSWCGIPWHVQGMPASTSKMMSPNPNNLLATVSDAVKGAAYSDVRMRTENLYSTRDIEVSGIDAIFDERAWWRHVSSCFHSEFGKCTLSTSPGHDGPGQFTCKDRRAEYHVTIPALGVPKVKFALDSLTKK